jgi:DNA repair protein RadC
MDFTLKGEKIKEIRLDERPRELMARMGKDTLRIDEILSLLIGSGIPNKSALDLSKDILNSIKGDLNKLGRFNQFDFMKFKGIGIAKSAVLVAALELGRRRMAFESTQRDDIILASKDAYNLLRPHLSDLGHEEFWIIHLNRASRLIKLEKFSVGGVAGTAVDIKLLFKSAIEQTSSAIILAHNHPSGQLQPSQADKVLTQKIIEAASLFEIHISDHLIVASENYFSFADEGIL